MACYDLLFEASLQQQDAGSMILKCYELRNQLHTRQEDVKEVFEEVSAIFLKLFQFSLEQDLGEMAQFLRIYMKQVEFASLNSSEQTGRVGTSPWCC